MVLSPRSPFLTPDRGHPVRLSAKGEPTGCPDDERLSALRAGGQDAVIYALIIQRSGSIKYLASNGVAKRNERIVSTAASKS
jgi:hypothetical protein